MPTPLDQITANLMVAPENAADMSEHAVKKPADAEDRHKEELGETAENQRLKNSRKDDRQRTARQQDSDIDGDDDADDADDTDDLDEGTNDRQTSSKDDDGTDEDAAGDDTDDEDEDDLAGIFDDEADHDRGANGEGDEFDTSTLGEDVKFSVTVDGEEQEVTLGDLKRRYAGEGAIDRRLQEATETRKKAFEDYEKGSTVVKEILRSFGEALFRRVVPAPDEGLLNTNPAQYMKQKAQYDKEGVALQQSHAKLYNMLEQAEQTFNDQKAAARQAASVELRRIMPVFNDPVKGPKVRTALIEAAREIGYTDQQISECVDPLMFKTVALAARELRRMKGVKAERQKEKTRTTKKKGEANRTKAGTAQRKYDAAMQRARKTRSIKDIEDTLMVPVKKTTRR